MVALAPNTSETSTWDILDGFSKLHSRAREAITGSCTEAPHSKSRSGIEIWQVVFESCDGLESFTRDPIGYHDGYLLYASTFATMSAVDPSGLEVEDPKIGCTDFLPEILALDPDDLGPYPRAKEQLQRGPRFFCGDCGFQNYSWQSPDDGGCIICLNAGSPDKHKDEWIAIMIHELTHCDQFQCKGKKAPPRIIDPVPLAPPKKFPGTPEEQCKSCRDWEGNAYKEQCHYLFPGPKNTKKREECIEAGKCYSCNPVCKGVATVAKKCEGLEFPIFVPPRLPPTQPPSPKK